MAHEARMSMAAQVQEVSAWRLALRHEMQQCRLATLALFEQVDRGMFCCQPHPDFSPIGWHLGHIAYTEALWILEHCAGRSPVFPQYRRLFAADGLPKGDRVHLPDLAEILDYLAGVRQEVFEYLEAATSDQERLWRWLLQHESQHCETIALVLELQGRDRNKQETSSSFGRSPIQPRSRSNPAPSPTTSSITSMIFIPEGRFCCGSDAIEALDNERPSHWVNLDGYWIDRFPVTCGEYREFMAAGGYEEPEWWSAEGWAWRQTSQATEPLYWRGQPGEERLPVCGVSWYEADAYARFVGKRLPTEFEWEVAARWHPETGQMQSYPWGEAAPTPEVCNYGHWVGQRTEIDRYPAGQSAAGCWDLLGNGWEWTASWFSGYPQFEPFPYRGYSQAYFDDQHRVLRGGSWATRSWALRSSFRNWYHPHVREVLAGFRCAVSDSASDGYYSKSP